MIVIEQENRSFDNDFGTYPGADGIPMKKGTPTVCVPNPPTGGCTAPYHDTADEDGGGPHNEADALADVNDGSEHRLRLCPRIRWRVDPYIVLGSAVVGFLVGVTGAGGGALMTPMLILLFSVKPSTAISSDLVAAVVMRPIGAAVHLRQRTVNLHLVGWMTLGSAPMAFFGAYLLHRFGSASAAEKNVEMALGAALLVGAAAMILRYVLDSRAGHTRQGVVHDLPVRPLPTLAIGMIGGLIVGITSVGSGSLMIVMLLFLYPMLGANQLVGTDLTQAVPLTLAAALGALAFGHVELSVTTSIIVGSVPAVFVGSLLSSRAPDRYIRPAITFVIFASGLKYVGVGTTALGWVLCGVLLVAACAWLTRARPWEKNAGTVSAVPDDGALSAAGSGGPD